MKTLPAILCVILPVMIYFGGSQAFSADDSSNLLDNGNFDNSGTADEGWENQGAKVVTGLDGKGNAIYIPAGGRYGTTQIKASPRLVVEFDFASERPTASANGFLLDLRAGGPPVIRLQFMSSGKLAVCGKDKIEYPLPELKFSVDEDENGSLGDANDTKEVHHVKIEQDGTLNEPTFNITVTDSSGQEHVAEGLTAYADPELSKKRIYNLLFIVPEGTAGVTIDNVKVTE